MEVSVSESLQDMMSHKGLHVSARFVLQSKTFKSISRFDGSRKERGGESLSSSGG